MVASDPQVDVVRSVVQEPVGQLRRAVAALEGLSVEGPSISAARFEQRAHEVALTLAETAEVLGAISQRFRDGSTALTEARAESLRKYFSPTSDITARFTTVMNFFRDTDDFVALSTIAPLLVQAAGLRREDALEQARRRLERFKDCGLLEVRRHEGSWSYRITEEALRLIDRGAFESFAVRPRQ
jgi:hypothetical protein